jgi:CrcB protein
MSTLIHLGLVAVGSALGGLARYGVANLATGPFGLSPHWAILFINISGSLVLGWFSTLLAEVWTAEGHPWLHTHAEHWRLLVAVGFTGGYTTFSTFEADTYALFRAGAAWTAIFYVTGSVFLGLVAFRIGMLLAGWK